MAINKIVFDARVLIDLTEDTVTADTLVEGVTAHDRSGKLIIGTCRSNTSQDLINFIEGNISGSYYIPEGTTKIGYAKFKGFDELIYVSFPNSIEQINDLAFADIDDCFFDFSNLDHIPVLPHSTAFTISNNIEIRVPISLYDTWITTDGWSDLAERITTWKLNSPAIYLDDGILKAPYIYLESYDEQN